MTWVNNIVVVPKKGFHCYCIPRVIFSSNITAPKSSNGCVDTSAHIIRSRDALQRRTTMSIHTLASIMSHA